jgi:hypothetical protein
MQGLTKEQIADEENRLQLEEELLRLQAENDRLRLGSGLPPAPRHPRVAALELMRLSVENQRKADQLAESRERDLKKSEAEDRRLREARPATEEAFYLSDEVGWPPWDDPRST